MNLYNFFKSSIFIIFCGLLNICYGFIRKNANDNVHQSLFKEEFLSDKGSPNSTMKISATEKSEEDGGSIKILTIIICCVTVFWWFITLIVAFILCMKYMGTQKKRAPPPPREDLSNIEYEEFSEVPDEANYIEKNSKIQGIKNKMGRAVKRGGGGKKQDGSAQDEFAI